MVNGMETEAFKRVVEIVGSKAEIARQCGVSGQHIQKWKSRVPAIHVVKLEKLTGGAVRREELRPDVFYD
jgi:DNA-binding transcriptional regulator YdaS (Cro superfamily)